MCPSTGLDVATTLPLERTWSFFSEMPTSDVQSASSGAQFGVNGDTNVCKSDTFSVESHIGVVKHRVKHVVAYTSYVNR